MLTANDLKRVYALYSSSRWRGDAAGEALEEWFRAHWVDTSHDQPEGDPAAISPHAAGGRGIYWYDHDATILGFIPGQSGCYLISRSESVPVPLTLRPARTTLSLPRPSVAHFQSGTWARHLLPTVVPPERALN